MRILLRKLSVSHLRHWVQARGVFDFAGVSPGIMTFLGTTGGKFTISPTFSEYRSALNTGWNRFERSVLLNAYFKVQNQLEDSAAAQDTSLRFLEPAWDDDRGFADDRHLLVGSRRRRLRVDTFSGREATLFRAMSNKTWIPKLHNAQDYAYPDVVNGWLKDLKTTVFDAIAPYPPNEGGIRYRSNVRDHRPLRALRDKQHLLHIGPPDKFQALIVQNVFKYRLDMKAHLADGTFYQPLLDPDHERAALTEWNYIFERFGPWLKDHSGIPGIWAHRIFYFIFGGWATLLRDMLSGVKPFFYAKFQGTYKLHKQSDIDMKRMQSLKQYPTETIPVRPIINSVGDWRKPAAFWIAQLLQPIVEKLPGVTCTSKQTIHTYESLEVPPESVLVEFDIKDFFLNINVDFCVQATSWAIHMYASYINGPIKDLILYIIHHLLNHNYFRFDGLPFRQRRGVAMGLDCAPQVAAISAYYYEKHRCIQEHPGILAKSWSRYLDDGLFVWVGSDRELLRLEALLNTPCCTPLGQCQFVYKFATSRSKAVFLDLQFSKSGRWVHSGILDVSLYCKPSNPHAYIPQSSHHAPSLAISWIRQEAKRRITHNADASRAMADLAQFGQLIISRGYSGQQWRRAIRGLDPSNRMLYLGLHAQVEARASDTEQARVLTLVLPHHRQAWSRVKQCVSIPAHVQRHLTAQSVRFACTNSRNIISHIRG